MNGHLKIILVKTYSGTSLIWFWKVNHVTLLIEVGSALRLYSAMVTRGTVLSGTNYSNV